jgi:hypothetical protein
MARDIKHMKKDLMARLEDDLNGLVQIALDDLATPEVSPVLTGFFASSWKAATSRPRARDERENFSPWDKIETVTMPSGYVELASGSQPIIQPRHSVPRFKLNQSVFIGNTVKYASDALVSPKNNISNYVQGEFKDLVKYVFSDKKSPTRIRVASGQGSGGRNLFNLFSPGTKYVSYEVPGESS